MFNNGHIITVIILAIILVNVSIVSSTNVTDGQLEKEDGDCEIKSYRGYKLIRITPKDQEQLKLVQTSFDDDPEVF